MKDKTDSIYDWELYGTPGEYMIENYEELYASEDFADERWKYCEDIPCLMVSDYGRFYNTRTKRFVNPTHGDKAGHKAIKVSIDGVRYQEYAHRLIAKAFIPNPSNYPFVRHLDDDKNNNDIENLEWGTAKDNVHDMIRNGTYVPFSDEDREKNLQKQRTPIWAIEISTGEKTYFRSQQDAAHELGIEQANIWKVLHGERKKTCGYTFEFYKGENEMKKPTLCFPEYEYIPGPENKGKGRNMFRGIDLGFGGYVYAVPGMYYDVALLDVQNMHGQSIENLNLFGEYTKNYADIRKIRNCIKRGDFETPKHMFGGKLIPYLQDKNKAEALSAALKLPCNQTYGLTSATFPNRARDERNRNNIVALLGAIFMKMLQDELEKKGYPVVHIKTDSCKVPGATPEIIKFIQDFALEHGYIMEHECTYERMCLVNDAVYIAKYDDKGIRNKGGKHPNEWTATGTQFQVPYVFKTLFSHEDLVFRDLCEIKTVSKKDSNIYLDFNEDLPDTSHYEKLKEAKQKIEKDQKVTNKIRNELISMGDPSYEELDKMIAEGHDYQFIGRVGLFCPVKEGTGGGILCKTQNGNYNSVTGTKGYRWKEAEIVEANNLQDTIDLSYYDSLVDKAIKTISQFGNYDDFVS